MNYYKFHIGDYRRDTAHLSLLEHGIYRQLLDQYYLTEKPLPAETVTVMRRLSARSEDEQKAVETVLKEFFVLQNGWHHKRCGVEIADYNERADQAREAGKLGGRPRKTATVILDNREQSGMKADAKPTTNHKPLTINQEPVLKTKAVATLPDWVPVEFWEAFKKHRGTKFTEYAQKLILSELERLKNSGSDPKTVLENSIRSGWKDVYAEKHKGQTNGRGYESERDKSRRIAVRELTGYDPDAIKGVSTRID